MYNIQTSCFSLFTWLVSVHCLDTIEDGTTDQAKKGDIIFEIKGHCHEHCIQLGSVEVHGKENPIYVLRSLSPNFHVHVSVSNLYIPKISPHISLQQNE